MPIKQFFRPTNKSTLYWLILGAVVLAVGGIIVWNQLENYMVERFAKYSDTAKFEDNKKKEEIDTSTWKTYRNEEYGFEVKYPNYWYFKKYTNIIDNKNIIEFVGFDSKPLPERSVEYVGKIVFQILNTPVSELIDKHKYVLENFSQSQIVLDNINAVRTEGKWPKDSLLSGAKDISVIFEYKNKTFYIGLYSFGDIQDEKIFNQILSTFKFIE